MREKWSSRRREGRKQIQEVKGIVWVFCHDTGLLTKTKTKKTPLVVAVVMSFFSPRWALPPSDKAAAGPELWTQLGLQVLNLDRLGVPGAGEAGGTRDLGERLLIGWRQVDHDEDAVRAV